MLHMSRVERQYSAAFLIAFLAAVLVNILSQFPAFPPQIHLPSSLLYCFLIIAWAETVALRIVHRRIRRQLIAVAVFLLLLFVTRICRYVLFKHSPAIMRYLWYLYYTPFAAMPMLSLSTAYCVGRDEHAGLSGLVKVLWLIAGALMLSILTNDLHHFALTFEGTLAGNDLVHYHWLYYVLFLWAFAVTLGAFLLLVRRCRLSQCRKLWYIPILPSSAALALIILYHVVGGSPRVLGISLYNIQEIYLALFIGLWEGSIKIGLIPSNSGYNTLFERTRINAEIKNARGETVYRSLDYFDAAGREDQRVNAYPIKGGSVTWSEDRSAVNRINRDLEDALEQIREENVLIEEENRVSAEKARYETQNRLYDRIARHVRPQLTRIDEALNDDGGSAENLRFCLLLGTYCKRCSNLMLIAGERREISTDELFLSIRESAESLKGFGIDCELINAAPKDLPSEWIIAAYDVFEAVLESALESASALSVKIAPSQAVLLSIETDGAPPSAEAVGLPDSALRLSVFEEDETAHIRLSTGGADHG